MNGFYQTVAEWARIGYVPAMFEHAFMTRGLLAALMVGPLLGGLGVVVVTKKLSFFTQTIGNAALTGVALGLLIGEPMDRTYGGLYAFCLTVAWLMTFLRHRTRFASDTVIGVVLAQTLGLGIVMLVLVTKQFNIHQIEAVLFGSLITISDRDLLILAGTGFLATVSGAWIFNRAMLVSFNPVMARARGLNPVWIDYLFVTILTAVVVAALKLVGALLVLVLVVVPAAAAQNVARGLAGFFWLSVVFSMISTSLGLAVSGTLPIPTGGSIVLVASVLFYLTLFAKPFLGRPGAHQSEE